MTEHAALTGSFVGLKTMADGTPRITVELDGTLAQVGALNLKPGSPLAIAVLTQAAAGEDLQRRVIDQHEGERGRYYQRLHQMGWFWHPAVWRAMGSDDEYRAWIQCQPSCVSGEFSEFVNGEGRCIAAHVRRVADGAGMAEKPPYACVPLTDAEHQLQHQKGESALGGKEFFDKKRGDYLAAWVKASIYAEFGVSSMKDIDPALFQQHIIDLGIGHTLPR